MALGIEFLGEQIASFSSDAFELGGDSGLSICQLLPVLLCDGIDGVF
jgi:hypothetical protein